MVAPAQPEVLSLFSSRAALLCISVRKGSKLTQMFKFQAL
jgi:hypothetical protein